MTDQKIENPGNSEPKPEAQQAESTPAAKPKPVVGAQDTGGRSNLFTDMIKKIMSSDSSDNQQSVSQKASDSSDPRMEMVKELHDTMMKLYKTILNMVLSNMGFSLFDDKGEDKALGAAPQEKKAAPKEEKQAGTDAKADEQKNVEADQKIVKADQQISTAPLPNSPPAPVTLTQSFTQTDENAPVPSPESGPDVKPTSPTMGSS